MEAMDRLNSEVKRLLRARERRRRQLAMLPFPEKVRRVVQLQRMVAPILRARGRRVQVWEMAGHDPDRVRAIRDPNRTIRGRYPVAFPA